MSGKLVIISAPSGAGKTTIVKQLLSRNLNLEFSISATTRAMRPGELDGRDYYFLSPEEFRTRIKNNEFIEWEEVYKDSYYGTLKTEIDRISSNGNNVLFDVDVVGGLNIKNIYKDRAVSIFIMPPSIDILKERLISRHTESSQSLEKRIGKAENELTFAPKFDVVIINDKLEIAVRDTEKAISDFIKK